MPSKDQDAADTREEQEILFRQAQSTHAKLGGLRTGQTREALTLLSNSSFFRSRASFSTKGGQKVSLKSQSARSLRDMSVEELREMFKELVVSEWKKLNAQ